MDLKDVGFMGASNCLGYVSNVIPLNLLLPLCSQFICKPFPMDLIFGSNALSVSLSRGLMAASV